MKAKGIIAAFIATLFLLSACGTTATSTPTVDVNDIYTAAAQTVIAELTTTAAANTATPAVTATEILATGTATSIPTSASMTETATAQPTLNADASPVAQDCDNATWVADVSVQDGTEMSPGQDFEKTWRIKNVGSCTWGAGYKLSFGYGETMNGQARSLETAVAPNESVEVYVVFTAPLKAGSYQSYWRMANAAGANFGEFFYVDIVVR